MSKLCIDINGAVTVEQMGATLEFTPDEITVLVKSGVAGCRRELRIVDLVEAWETCEKAERPITVKELVKTCKAAGLDVIDVFD